jgi:hypothetical protein
MDRELLAQLMARALRSQAPPSGQPNMATGTRMPPLSSEILEPNMWQPEERNPFAGITTYDWKHPGVPPQPTGWMERNLLPLRGGPKVSDWARLNSEYEKY